MLNNIVKYNGIKLQEALDEYLDAMLKTLEEDVRIISITGTEQYAAGYRKCMEMVRMWLSYGRE